MKYATCIRCGATLYPDDHNPEAPGLCGMCQKIEEEASRVCEAEREAMRTRIASVQQQIRAAEVTPAGLNYLLPGIEPIHTTPPTEGQARLL